MDVFQLIRMLRRWWFVTIPAVALTTFAAVAVTDSIQPEYTAEGSVLFEGPVVRESPNAPGEFEVINPLLEQASALTTAAVITSLSVDTPDVAAILAAEGLSTDYEVGAENRTPILLLVTRGDSREQAIGTALRLTELIDQDVRLRQEAADVPPNQLVTTSVIGLSSVGGADYGARNRLRLILVTLGLAASVGAVFALEGLRRRGASRLQLDNDPLAYSTEPIGAAVSGNRPLRPTDEMERDADDDGRAADPLISR